MSRRTLLVGGGAGAGLLVAWTLWPRAYRPNLHLAPGETLFNAFLKIGADGRVTVAVPQAEIGQGVWTSLPQILSDELGADWRTVAVEPAPLSALYANAALAGGAAEASVPAFARGAGTWVAREYGVRNGLAVTAGSTSVRAFQPRMREAGAAARALLMMAAARIWGGGWRTLDTKAGFVTDGRRRLRFAELAEAAAGETLPDDLPVRGGLDNRLYGQPAPRLDLPSKIDGSARFAADVRLPGMLYAAVHSGPAQDSRLVRIDRSAARRVAGVVDAVEQPGWVAVLASNGWAAERALAALAPVWNTPHALPDEASIDAALTAALREAGRVVFSAGDMKAPGRAVSASYSAGPAANAPLEPLTATARPSDEGLEVWAPVQSAALARAAAARAAGIKEDSVTIYPTFVGGGYGRKMETRAVEQAAVLALHSKRPVQVMWSRIEETVQDSFRPPARAELSATLGEGGMLASWGAKIAAPEVAPQLEARLGGGARLLRGIAAATAGAVPPYDIAAVQVTHAAAKTGLSLGLWRSAAHVYTAFFTESFVDELARAAGIEPLSFRMQMLGGNPRLARCLTSAATLGGWDGGPPGSALGLACHAAFGSYIATVVQAAVEAGRPRAVRAVCAVDCGRVVNPNLLRQQIEGGLVFGLAAACAAPLAFAGGRPTARGFGHLDFPGLAAMPEVTVEIVESEETPGGASELAVPTAAPALANALFALTGKRLRSLPLVLGGSA